MAVGTKITVTLVRVDMDNAMTRLEFDASTRPTLANLIRMQGMVAFKRDDGSYYEDMTLPLAQLDGEHIKTLTWEADMIAEQPAVVAQQHRIIHEDLMGMLADPRTTPDKRVRIKMMLKYLENGFKHASTAGGDRPEAETAEDVDG